LPDLPRLVFDRRDESGDDDVDEEADDEEVDWAPGPAEQAGRFDLSSEQLGGLAVFGGLLIVVGIYLQLSTSWSRPTVLGVGFILIFATLMFFLIGSESGVLPIVSAGGASLVALVAQFSNWPRSPPLWLIVLIGIAGAIVLAVGFVTQRRVASRDATG